MDEGTLVNESDRIQTFRHPDRPDLNVEVDLGTGNASVSFATDQGTEGLAAIEKDLEVGMTDPGELIDEGLEGGITNLQEFLRNKNKMFRGGVPKGLEAAMRAIMSKFGDDAITTADKVESKSKVFDDFEARNPNPNKQMTDEEIREFADEFGLDPSEEYYSWDGTLTDARRILKEDEDYKASMFKEYKAGRLDPEAGSVSQARLSFLRQKEQLAADMGNEYKYRLTEDEIAELDYLEDYFRKDYLDFKAQQTDRKMTQEEIEELKELGEKGFKDGGDVSLTVIKIPDISESGVESLFKRR